MLEKRILELRTGMQTSVTQIARLTFCMLLQVGPSFLSSMNLGNHAGFRTLRADEVADKVRGRVTSWPSSWLVPEFDLGVDFKCMNIFSGGKVRIVEFGSTVIRKETKTSCLRYCYKNPSIQKKTHLNG